MLRDFRFQSNFSLRQPDEFVSPAERENLYYFEKIRKLASGLSIPFAVMEEADP